jgi:hypothetical protein
MLPQHSERNLELRRRNFVEKYSVISSAVERSRGSVAKLSSRDSSTPLGMTVKNGKENMSEVSVVPIGKKKCKPFILEVFVASPEAGYKFDLLVEKACSSENDPLWKLVFDLYKKNGAGAFDQIVHVSFRALDPNERQGVENLSVHPISFDTASIVVKEVHPAAKAVAGVPKPTPKQKKKLHDAMSRAAVSALEV